MEAAVALGASTFGAVSGFVAAVLTLGASTFAWTGATLSVRVFVSGLESTIVCSLSLASKSSSSSKPSVAIAVY